MVAPILVDRGLVAGALGYAEDSAGEELVEAVHAGLGGDRYVSRALRGPKVR